MPHPVVHFVIGCRDSVKTQEFYGKLFNWKMSSFGPAVMIAAEKDGIGGHLTSLGHEPHQYVLFYVAVNDMADALARSICWAAKFWFHLWRFPPAHLRGCKILRETRLVFGKRRSRKKNE